MILNHCITTIKLVTVFSPVTNAVVQWEEDQKDSFGSLALQGDVQQEDSLSDKTILENDIATVIHDVFTLWKIETEVFTKTVQILAEDELGDYAF